MRFKIALIGILCLDLVFSEITLGSNLVIPDLVNNVCKNHIELYNSINVLNFNKTNAWAIKMRESGGSTPAGLLLGNVNSGGSYSSCIEIDVKDPIFNGQTLETFGGRYLHSFLWSSVTPPDNDSEILTPQIVREHLHPREFNINPLASGPLVPRYLLGLPLRRHGMCLPSSCSFEESGAILQATLKELDTDENQWNSVSLVGYSPKDEIPLDAWDFAFISILCVFGALVLIGTILTILVEQNLINADSNAFLFWRGLSALETGRKILNARKPDSGGDHLTAIGGIRFFSMVWVLVCHVYGIYQLQIGVVNLLQLPKYFEGFWSQFVLNGYPSVDSFYFLSGTLVAYLTFKEIERCEGRFNLIVFYIHRYLRLTGVYFMVLLFRASLLKFLISGPNVANDEVTNCRQVLWRQVLYINNFYPKEDQAKYPPCAGPSWYLATDMQMFLVTPFLMYPMWRFKKFFFNYFWPIVWILVSTITIMVLTEVVVLIGWIVALGGLFAVVYGLNLPSYFGEEMAREPTRATAISYGGLHRLTWGIALSWVVWACTKGYGGWINSFLSWEGFIPLARLTYVMYLIHDIWVTLYAGKYLHTITFNHFEAALASLWVFAVTTVVAFPVVVCIEAPILHLEKFLFSKLLANKPKQSST
eukprot:TCALIF_12469-PA protein Name:"Similar to nrf-6 Nose resistant to fluoxetine protein 6 (Caenorhabditis elegans)" AED:0.06 eAED:0.04 QI:8/0.90/0.75/1/0.90/0.91/12/23/645